MTQGIEDVVAAAREGGEWSVRGLGGLVDRLAGRPELWRDSVLHRDGARWYTRLHRDGEVEVWLITWARDTATEMHDHGGSSGAFRVVDGALTEDRATPAGVRRRRVPAGRTVAFGPEHVHDVTNVDPEPAFSIHAYSPPLATMTYYRPEGAGVSAVRTVEVDDRVPA